MRLLLDTHLLVWLSVQPERLSPSAVELIRDVDNSLFFSAVGIWEVAIKRSLERPDFDVDPAVLHSELLDHGYHELPVDSRHAMMVQRLPHLHRDPFDRLMLAQAIAEGMTMLTADRLILQYGQPAQPV